MNLERRFEELSDEIRNYPTPIARCDEQLTALLDERSRLRVLLEAQHRKPPGGCTPDAVWTNDGGAGA